MANDKTKTTAPVTDATSGTESWDEVERSFPLYNVDECQNRSIRGYPCDVKFYGKAPDDLFKVIVVKLTAPTLAKDNDKIVEVPAGKCIAVRGADLRDLEEVALHPDIVREYLLTPMTDKEGKLVKIKMKDSKKAAMPRWTRKLNPTPFKRSEVCPQALSILPPADMNRLFLAQKNGEENADFSPEEMRQQ